MILPCPLVEDICFLCIPLVEYQINLRLFDGKKYHDCHRHKGKMNVECREDIHFPYIPLMECRKAFIYFPALLLSQQCTNPKVLWPEYHTPRLYRPVLPNYTDYAFVHIMLSAGMNL